MPELPEVETTLKGIAPHLLGKKLTDVHIRHHQLRWPLDKKSIQSIVGQKLLQIERRAKYLLLYFKKGTLIIHLGMSGKLSILHTATPATQHDHCDFIFGNIILRYNDPRRFGAILWTEEEPLQHTLLKNLGPEPLTKNFNYKYLYQICQNKKKTIKSVIMDSHIVVGVGNIYANEALFLARVHPAQPAYLINQAAVKRLTQTIKITLKKAIKAGGTTLRDFLQADGNPGYFTQQLQVYDRKNQPCFNCQLPIVSTQQQQRATYFCANCQTIYK
jgi:formamidopyrimidine-DNA glycosylase